MEDVPHFPVAIIGGGPSGICVGAQLTRQLGWDYVLFEKSAAVGGTWYENSYPGAACDVPSHLYSFSFAPKPDWSEAFSPAPEIRAYFEDLAAAEGVLRRARLGTQATAVVWDEAASLWRITYIDVATRREGRVTARYVVSCVGALHQPRLPDIPGVGRFRGPTLHSAKWDRAVSLEGKTVAIVGTGASCVQILPAIAPLVRGAYVFQRSAAWVTPRLNAVYSDWARSLFRTFPFLVWLLRWFIYVRLEFLFFGLIRHPAAGFLRSLIVGLATRHRRQQVAKPPPGAAAAPPAAPGSTPFVALDDASLRTSLRGGQGLEEALTPRYPVGCKRITPSDHYLRAFARPNVALVTQPILRIEEDAVVVRGGEGGETRLPIDVLVYTTGFDVLGSLLSCSAVGRGGLYMTREWAIDADNYYGILSPSFPNLFMCLGPNTGLGHNSILAMVESQVDFILACMRRTEATGSVSVEVKPAAAAAFTARMQAELTSSTVWTQCSSWYNLEGRKNVTLWPHTVSQYWWETRPSRIDWAALEFRAAADAGGKD